MTLSIRTKLFLTLLLTSVLVASGVLAFVHWSFQRGLVELATSRRDERIGWIGERLVEAYVRDGGWEPLRHDRQRWLAILLERPDHDHPRRGSRWLGEGRGWPPEAVLRRLAAGQPQPLPLRLMLLDADGEPIHGRRSLLPGSRRYPLESAGRRIGELALIPGPPISDALEQRFLGRQRLALLVIALATLVLSALLTLPLAGRLIRPLRAFQHAARRLAAGDYRARVAIRGGDELANLGRDLDGLAAALQQHEQARRRWVADISHELRTPLSVLRGELEALQDGVRSLDRAAVDRLHADVLRLGRLVDDLYELSMSDLGALRYRKALTDVADVLAQDVAAYRAEYAAAGLRLTYAGHGDATLSADAQRLSQLFRNLLRNSLSYTDPGGGLWIGIAREDQRLVIDFEDTAPGAPAEDLPHLFDPLYRAEHSRSRATGGAGLGLAICKRIVEAHGGEIEARPSPRGGLWVRILLPVAGGA